MPASGEDIGRHRSLEIFLISTSALLILERFLSLTFVSLAAS
jgi:hypothetical protein